MPLDREKIVAVTGANSKFFLHVLLLLESYAHFCRGRVMVCDYGLTDAEKAFLARYDCVLASPLEIEPGRHAWYYKAALQDYVPQVPWTDGGGVLWLDADAIVTDDIVGRLISLAGDPPGRSDVYACAEKHGGFGPIIDALRREGRADVLELYANRFKVTADTPYLSSGIFLVLDPDILTEWRDIVWSAPPHVLFEQNAFNFAIRNRRVGVLEPEVFNVTQWDLLSCALRAPENVMTTADGRRIAFLHMTANGEDIIESETVAFEDGRGRALIWEDYKLRRPKNPSIRMMQDAFLSRVVRTGADEMVDLGLARLRA